MIFGPSQNNQGGNCIIWEDDGEMSSLSKKGILSNF